mmetsp:Transcript_10388/g.36867  ORF Transcript_10388/g.36867 Transcript_10388/m.36867 type:complete len:228 (-) Transcript_10388:5246-5929(-)
MHRGRRGGARDVELGLLIFATRVRVEVVLQQLSVLGHKGDSGAVRRDLGQRGCVHLDQRNVARGVRERQPQVLVVESARGIKLEPLGLLHVSPIALGAPRDGDRGGNSLQGGSQTHRVIDVGGVGVHRGPTRPGPFHWSPVPHRLIDVGGVGVHLLPGRPGPRPWSLVLGAVIAVINIDVEGHGFQIEDVGAVLRESILIEESEEIGALHTPRGIQARKGNCRARGK